MKTYNKEYDLSDLSDDELKAQVGLRMAKVVLALGSDDNLGIVCAAALVDSWKKFLESKGGIEREKFDKAVSEAREMFHLDDVASAISKMGIPIKN